MKYKKRDKIIGEVRNMLYFDDTKTTIFEVETLTKIKYYLINKDKQLILRGELKK